jgi:hypothetical protein
MNKRSSSLRSTSLLIICAILLLAVSAATPVHAQQVPVSPQAFFGTIEINGQQAPVGTAVEARSANVKTGVLGNPITTTVTGGYGTGVLSVDTLIVQGTLDLTNGAPLEFYINGQRAECAEPGGAWQSTYPFTSEGVTQLNLRLGQSAPPGATVTPTPTATQAADPTATPTATAAPTATATRTPVPATHRSGATATPKAATQTPTPPPTAPPVSTATATQPPPAEEASPTAESGQVAQAGAGETPTAVAPTRSVAKVNTATPAASQPTSASAATPAKPRATSAPILSEDLLLVDAPSPTPAAEGSGSAAATVPWVIGGAVVCMIPLGIVMVRRRRK